MYKRIDLEQGSAEWLEYRRTKIGASDAATIMGLNPWKKPPHLWEEKMGIKDVFINDAMKRGSGLENMARKKLECSLGIKLDNPTLESIEHPWMSASLDAYNEDHRILAEIKCPNPKWHQYAIEGEVPQHYYPQLQHQMAVTGIEMMIYYSFDGVDGIEIKVPRNEEFIGKMLLMEEHFYNSMILFDRPEAKCSGIQV